MTEIRKNEIFDAPAAKEQLKQVPPVPTGNVFDVPVIDAPLPSDGKVYPEGHPLHGQTSVLIEAMTARQENILTNRAYAKRGILTTELIKSCLKDRTIDSKMMLAGDRNTILISLRVSGYGPDYKAAVTCSACGESSSQEFDLSKLEVNRLKLEPVEPYTNLFSYTLPMSKATVRFRFLTGQQEEEITQQQMARKKKGLIESTMVTDSLLYSIVSITTKSGQQITDRAKIAACLPSLIAFDSRSLRNYIQDNEPGMDMRVWFDCPNCDHGEEVTMPLGASFFWPDA